MPKKKIKKVNQNTGRAFVTTFFSIVGFILAILAWRKDRYVMHYAAQSLIVFIIAVIGGVIRSIFDLVPVVGVVISVAINLAIFVLWLLSWINALSGKKKEVPVVGEYGRKVDL